MMPPPGRPEPFFQQAWREPSISVRASETSCSFWPKPPPSKCPAACMPETAWPRHPSGDRGHRLVHWLLLTLETGRTVTTTLIGSTQPYFFLRFVFLAFFFAGAFFAFLFFAVIGMSNDSSNVCSGPANRIPQNANNMSKLRPNLQYYPAFRDNRVFAR